MKYSVITVHDQCVWARKRVDDVVCTSHSIPNMWAYVTRGLFSYLFIQFTEIRLISFFRDRIEQMSEPQYRIEQRNCNAGRRNA